MYPPSSLPLRHEHPPRLSLASYGSCQLLLVPILSLVNAVTRTQTSHYQPASTSFILSNLMESVPPHPPPVILTEALRGITCHQFFLLPEMIRSPDTSAL
ncbi:hypothetical protein AAHC03_017107 [Spirometra sp. Aus1]